eukprot:91762-Pleurochrysis_carterae.AAC.1
MASTAPSAATTVSTHAGSEVMSRHNMVMAAARRELGRESCGAPCRKPRVDVVVRTMAKTCLHAAADESSLPIRSTRRRAASMRRTSRLAEQSQMEKRFVTTCSRRSFAL